MSLAFSTDATICGCRFSNKTVAQPLRVASVNEPLVFSRGGSCRLLNVWQMVIRHNATNKFAFEQNSGVWFSYELGVVVYNNLAFVCSPEFHACSQRPRRWLAFQRGRFLASSDLPLWMSTRPGIRLTRRTSSLGSAELRRKDRRGNFHSVEEHLICAGREGWGKCQVPYFPKTTKQWSLFICSVA